MRVQGFPNGDTLLAPELAEPVVFEPAIPPVLDVVFCEFVPQGVGNEAPEVAAKLSCMAIPTDNNAIIENATVFVFVIRIN